MNIRFFAFAALFSSVAVFGQTPVQTINTQAIPYGQEDSSFQVRYAANLAIGDSVVNFTNAGGSSLSSCLPGTPGYPCTVANAPSFAQNGDICANVYAYSPDEQLVSCCSCNVTPNALNSLSAKGDLASNTLTPIIPSALVIKVLASTGGASCTASSAATITTADLKQGLLAWGTTIHALPVTAGTPATTYGVTETRFANPLLTLQEFTRMTQLCAFIRANGSGYGICKSCKIGGLGASAK